MKLVYRDIGRVKIASVDVGCEQIARVEIGGVEIAGVDVRRKKVTGKQIRGVDVGRVKRVVRDELSKQICNERIADDRHGGRICPNRIP